MRVAKILTLVAALALGFAAANFSSAQEARDTNCFDVAQRAKNARLRAERALQRSAIAAARVDAEGAAFRDPAPDPNSLQRMYPKPEPTPRPETADREVLIAAYRRVKAVSADVLRFATEAQRMPAPQPSHQELKAGFPAPSDDLLTMSCTDLLNLIENQVFRLEQAMQLAELAADQAIARAALAQP